VADDVFETTDQGGEEQASLLDELVGDDKKFKTLDDLAKGKVEADAFIEKLKEENQMALDELKTLQEKGNNTAKVEDLIAAVKEAARTKDSEGNNQMSEEDLEVRIREIMQGVSAEETKKLNRDKGNELVLQKVGGDVEAAKMYVAERAKQLGMSPSKLAELSEISPDAFAKLIETGPSTGSSGTVPLQGSNPRAMENHTEVESVDGHHTKAYYDRLRKEMGTVKFLQDRRLQKSYLDDAMALQERFNPK